MDNARQACATVTEPIQPFWAKKVSEACQFRACARRKFSVSRKFSFKAKMRKKEVAFEGKGYFKVSSGESEPGEERELEEELQVTAREITVSKSSSESSMSSSSTMLLSSKFGITTAEAFWSVQQGISFEKSV